MNRPMALDINAIKDGVDRWHAETVKLAQANGTMNDEVKKLRIELESKTKSLAESQALNDSLEIRHAAEVEKLIKEHESWHQSVKAMNEELKKSNTELITANKELSSQAAADRKRCEEMIDHPDVKRRLLEQAKARKAKDDAEVERLEKELASPSEI